MNVVLYMRYSSDAQSEQSIEGQNRVCTEFCEREGHTIIARYIDRATSAYKDADKRVEFNRMIKDSEKHLWQGVVVYKLDRFARNRYDSANYKTRLKKNGVRVISATEGLTDSPESIILESVLEGMAEYYSVELAQKVKRGQIESEAKGNHLGSVPFGYRVENKKLVIDELRATIVREAFDLYKNGATQKEVAETLNAKGYRNAKGEPFTRNSFHNVFKNERYIGTYLHGDTRIEGGVPAIIDKETFDEVQEIRKKNAGAPGRGKAKVNYLLSQKLFCGHCGGKMVGESGISHTGQPYYYYACSNRKKHRSCDKKPVPKEWIEKIVAEEAKSILTPEMIEQIVEAADREERKRLDENTELANLKRELESTNTKIRNLVKALEGWESESVRERISELEAQKKQLTTNIAIEENKTYIVKPEYVRLWLQHFVSGDVNDPRMTEAIIDTLVNSVTIWDEPDGGYKVTIIHNITGDTGETIRCESSDLASGSPLSSAHPNLIIREAILIHTFTCRP